MARFQSFSHGTFLADLRQSAGNFSIERAFTIVDIHIFYHSVVETLKHCYHNENYGVKMNLMAQ